LSSEKFVAVAFLWHTLGVQSTSQFSLIQSGYQFSVQNSVAIASGGTLTVAYVVSGAPSTLTLYVQGVKNASSPVVIDTYSGLTSVTRTINISDSYDYFVVLPQWTGGNNVTVTVTVTFSGPGQSQTAITAAIPLSGFGSPAGVVAAPVGTMYVNLSGGSGALFLKESGGSTTAGWVASNF
jgi:hypothetical protein